jgi:hypothetical protein
MANLLPEKKMRAMQATFRDRFVMVGALSLILSALFASLLLLPSYLVLAASEPADDSLLVQAREDKQGIEDLKQAQSLLRDVAAIISATSSPSTAIAQVTALRPRGILLTRISYQVPASAGQLPAMSVSGIGSNRDAIYGYRDALTRSERFPSVSIPVSAIVGATEGGGFTAILSTSY